MLELLELQKLSLEENYNEEAYLSFSTGICVGTSFC